MPVTSMGEKTTAGGRRFFRVVYEGVVDVNDGMAVIAKIGPGTPAFDLPQMYVYAEGSSMTAEVREAYGNIKDTGKTRIAIVLQSVQLRVQVKFLLRVLGVESNTRMFDTEEEALKWLDS